MERENIKPISESELCYNKMADKKIETPNKKLLDDSSSNRRCDSCLTCMNCISTCCFFLMSLSI